MSNYCVYAHINKINGKIYIGQTCDIQGRWKPSAYKNCIKFYNAIQKYGWDNFDHQILIDNLSLEEANEIEQFYIQKYDVINQGYNIYQGGNNREMTQETIEKLSEKSKSLWQDEEYRQKQHNGRLASWQGELGEKRKMALSGRTKKLWESEEYRKSKIKDGKDHPNARKIKCITTGEVFDSIADATRKYGVQHSNIYKCCRGQRKHCGRHPETQEQLSWEYYDE